MTDKQMACSTKTICKPELAAAKPPNIAATKVAGHTTTARPPVNTLQRPTIVIATRWSAPFRGCATPELNELPGPTPVWAQAGKINASDNIMQIRTNRIESRSEERRVGKECRSRWSPYH